MSAAQQWLENQPGFGRKLTPGQVRCLDTLCSIAAVYNLHLSGKDITNRFRFGPGDMLSVSLKNQLSTFDFDNLTRLVLAAHKNHVRVNISGKSLWSIQIDLHARRPRHPGEEGASWEHHPSLGDLAERARKMRDDQ